MCPPPPDAPNDLKHPPTSASSNPITNTTVPSRPASQLPAMLECCPVLPSAPYSSAVEGDSVCSRARSEIPPLGTFVPCDIDSSIMLPQCLHLIAAALISSAQKGHVLWSLDIGAPYLAQERRPEPSGEKKCRLHEKANLQFHISDLSLAHTHELHAVPLV
jgi:hypothetical protein